MVPTGVTRDSRMGAIAPRPRQGHLSRRRRLPAGGITDAVVVVKRGTRTCPLGVRRQERVAPQLTTAPLPGPNSTQQRAELSEHLPPGLFSAPQGLMARRGGQDYPRRCQGDPADPIPVREGSGRRTASPIGWDRATLLRARLGPRLVYTHRSRAVGSGHQRYVVRADPSVILRQQRCVRNPDNDEVLR